VGTASNAAIFVEWTRSGGQLSGELHQALLVGSGSTEQVSSQSEAFTGTVSGNSVTLSLNQGLGSVTNLTSTLDGQQLELNYPGEDGGLITIEMAPGGPSGFNSDLANLQGQAGKAQNQAAQQQAAQQQANSVASDAQAVSNDLITLQSSERDASGTGSVAGDLTQMRKDLGQTGTDLQHVLHEAGHTDVDTLCTDADTVSSDYDTPVRATSEMSPKHKHARQCRERECDSASTTRARRCRPADRTRFLGPPSRRLPDPRLRPPGRREASRRQHSRATSAGGWSCSPRATRRGSASLRRAS
jgi:hypothetical protein